MEEKLYIEVEGVKRAYIFKEVFDEEILQSFLEAILGCNISYIKVENEVSIDRLSKQI